jgi:hypothetical protein
VLGGSIQRFGTALQVNAQTIDAESGAHLWADRFDGDLSNLASLRDAVTTRVWRAPSVGLPGWEERRSLRERPDNPDAMDYVLRALAVWNAARAGNGYAKIRRLLETAVRIDPQSIYAQSFGAGRHR